MREEGIPRDEEGESQRKYVGGWRRGAIAAHSPYDTLREKMSPLARPLSLYPPWRILREEKRRIPREKGGESQERKKEKNKKRKKGKIIPREEEGDSKRGREEYPKRGVCSVHLYCSMYVSLA